VKSFEVIARATVFDRHQQCVPLLDDAVEERK